MKRVCGLDVHKDTIFCATYNGKKYDEVKEYSTLTSSIQAMGNDLKEKGVVQIAWKVPVCIGCLYGIYSKTWDLNYYLLIRI